MGRKDDQAAAGPDEGDGMVHIGRGVVLLKTTLENVEASATSNAVFVKNLAVALWGYDKLSKSSVFGKACPSKREEAPKPLLTPEKINAVTDCYMTYLKRKGMDENLLGRESKRVRGYICSKIQDLNRKKRPIKKI